MRQRSGIGCQTSAVVDVKRAAASGLPIQSDSGGMHDRFRQAIAPGKPELTIQAKGVVFRLHDRFNEALHRLSPMDLHAWFEAYVGGRWYTFDPTQDDLQGARVAIAYGRDAADVAVYTQFGDPVELLRMEVTVEQRAAPPV